MKTLPRPRVPWPSGLYYGWAIVGVGFLVSFAQVGAHNHPLGFFMRPMQAEFGWSRAQISAGAGIGSLGGGILAAVLGSFVDRHGTRGVLVVASLVLGIGLALLSLVHALWQFYLVYGLSRAASVGVMELALGVAVANWFVAQRARAMGLALVGRRLAIALLPILASSLILLWGWRYAWLGLGLTVLVLALLPAALLLRRRPEDLGLLPDGRAPGSAAAGVAMPAQESAWTLRAALGDRSFWLLSVASSLAMLVSGSVNLHQAPHLMDVGLSPGIAATVVAVFALSAAVGNIAFGLLAERWPIRYVIGLALVGSALGLALLTVTRTTGLAFVYGVVYGLSFGGLFTLFGVIFAEYFGRAAVGAIVGLTLPMSLGANALGPFFAGLMYDLRHSYTEVFLIFIGLFGLGAVLASLARPPGDGAVRAGPGPPGR